MKQYTQILSDYLAGLKYEDIPQEVIERAKLVTLHTIGAALSSLRSQSAQNIIAIAKDMAGGDQHTATIIGEGSRVSVTNAALANGTLADLMDWEDCSWTGHPSAGAVPAGLCVSEAYHKTGREYLTALVGGYDVYQRVAMAVQPTPKRFQAGWGLHCWQIFAPAAVTAKLFGLEGEKMNQMLGTAVTMTPIATARIHTSYSDFYHYTHGLTAKNAIECAMITQAGISTLTDALEADGGYYPGVSDQCDWDWFDKDLGRRHMIMELMQKNWPVNMWIQSPMDLIDSLYKKHRFDPDQVARIEVSPYIPLRSEDAPKEGYDSMVKAQFSIPFCLAMYLKGPKVGFDWLDAKYLTDPTILEMAGKVHGVGPESIIAHNFSTFQTGGYPEYGMKVIMRDGVEYSEMLAYPKGHPRNPYTREECIASFHLQAGEVMSVEKREAVIDFIFSKLDDCRDMAEISACLTV